MIFWAFLIEFSTEVQYLMEIQGFEDRFLKINMRMEWIPLSFDI